MRLTVFLLTATLIHAYAAGNAQLVTLSARNLPLEQVFSVVKRQTGYVVLGNKELLMHARPVNLSAADMPLNAFLDLLFKEQAISYIIKGKTIVLSPKSGAVTIKPLEDLAFATALPPNEPVRIKVIDSTGKPLYSAVVRIKNKAVTVPTGVNGLAVLEPGKGDVITVSFVGYETIEYTIGEHDFGRIIEIRLLPTHAQLNDVVIASGFLTRRAESFTGSAVTVTREELLRVGNQNILQSLKNIDPSFRIVENMSMGSNPNNLPEIQLRGQNSLPNLQGDISGNSNQPLFILDGFETTLQRVYDLNMNRVATITLLKDAAAKAIYGSRAANGVIVIETIRPAIGELKVSYSGDVTFEVPDLAGYNLMDAKEKLAFEKERGMYYRFTSGADDAQNRDRIYKQNYDNVSKGVNTYWLSKPLRTGVGNKHAINLEGGDRRMRYMAGVTFNKVAGVMIGSERNTLGINNMLSYTYKNLVFRNSLEYNRNWAKNSPYGSFSDYISLNQYYQPFDNNGRPVKILGENTLGNVFNPIYNASINTKSESGYSDLTNNFNVDWKISQSVRATGNLSYIRNENSSDDFYPASHTKFANYDQQGLSERKGQYTKGNGYYQFISSNIGINYNKRVGRHLFFTNATWNLTSRRTVTSSMVAEGFGNDNMDNISFASMYQVNGKPSGSDARVREIGLVGILNYSYDDRYFMDASVRTSGSSMYGSENRWGAFWSVGAGWNIHREKMLRSLNWITQLRLRGSMGYTGSQNFNPFQARARYSYGDIVYNGRLGAELLGLPNEFLRWQRTMDYNVGLDLGVKHFLTGRLEYFISRTSDLLSDMTVVPSMGFSSYKDNIGEIQNRGFEFNLVATPWRNDKKKAWVSLSVSAIHNKNKLVKIYDIFTSWNEKQDDIKNQTPTSSNYNSETLKAAYTRPATYLYEGQSMDAIWGVRSLGIDPVTGQEMYIDKDGNSTWVWKTADKTVIGNATPALRGNVGINAGYNGFTFAVACTYKFGGELYNTTLVDRVENVTGYDNLDRRILNSWRTKGDLSPYRVLTISAGTTPVYTKPTSRFVQRDNELFVSSLNLGYEFVNRQWMKRTGMDRLRFSFFMNELLRISSIQVERGTTYPFARNFSFMIQAGF